ncbi:MAG TPA: ABC transporter substrate-binding protein [Pyrinomonadaceae bacterium]|nr:ABC transporter substrate-binding protein [Pyrinomonadaceae bacterium]
MQRIVSFLPSATEIACALGLADSIVGITHECDYPPSIKSKPVVVRNVLPIERMSQSEIDRAVAERMRDGLSLYQIDEELLRALAPDLILTQNLCQVCAPSGNEVSQVIKALPQTPQILWLTPQSLSEIFDNVRDLGAATGRAAEAEALVGECEARLEKLRERIARVIGRPRVFCMEWLDPVYASGHWVPELVKLAGGVDELSRERGESVRVSWDDIAAWAPEVLVIMPCGFNLQQTMKQIWSVFGFQRSEAARRFFELPAVRNGRVYAMDANSYFARPGPRVVEGAELLARLIHPDVFANEPLPPEFTNAFQAIDLNLLKGKLNEETDYYLENGAMVFTAAYLKRRGYCCGSGCRHCPY